MPDSCFRTLSGAGSCRSLLLRLQVGSFGPGFGTHSKSGSSGPNMILSRCTPWTALAARRAVIWIEVGRRNANERQ